MQSSHPQTETKKEIAEVLRSVEARQFWERVYIAAIRSHQELPMSWGNADDIADKALNLWRERFEPKAGE
jgi:hypothetical protein